MFRYLRPAILTACTLLGGCAGTQSQMAFAPRHAATVVHFVPSPNVSDDHEDNLEAALKRSLFKQELRDERADLQAPPVPAQCTFACGSLTHPTGPAERSEAEAPAKSAVSADERPKTDERSAKEAPAQEEAPAQKDARAEAKAPAAGDEGPGVADLQP